MERIKQIVILMAMVLGIVLVGNAQITLPYGPWTTSVPVAQLNSNITTLSSNALNRNGGTVAGNIAVNSGVTIDGTDISAALGGSGNPTFASVTISGTGASAIDVAGGINAGSSNVGIIGTDGRIPAISSTYFSSLSGSSLTGLVFSQLPTTWTSVSYSSGNFTASGSMTWTVESGDVVSIAYVELGKTMIVAFDVQTTTVGGTVAAELRMAIPNSRSAARTVSVPFSYLDNSTAGTGTVTATGSTLAFYKSLAGTNWTASSNATRIQGAITFEIS